MPRRIVTVQGDDVLSTAVTDAAIVRASLPRNPMIFRKCPEGALAWALAGWATQGRVWLHVTERDAALANLSAMVRGFSPDLEVVVLPAWDSLPYDRAKPSPEVTGARVAALFQMMRKPDRPRLVLTSAAGLLQRVPAPARLSERAIRLVPGDEAEIEWLESTLTAFGYVSEERVDSPGQFAQHGGGADLFPAGAPAPVRLEIEAGHLEMIRAFDPADQRSIDVLDAITLLPVSEAFAVPGEPIDSVVERLLPEGELETLVKYLPDVVFSLDAGVPDRLDDWRATIQDAYEARLVASRASGDGAAEPPDRIYLTVAETAELVKAARVRFADNGTEIAQLVPGEPAATTSDLVRLVRNQVSQGDAVLVCAADAGPIAAMLRRRFGHEVPILPEGPAISKLLHCGSGNWEQGGRIAVARFPITEGFRLDGLSILAGPTLRSRPQQRNTTVLIIEQLLIGDLVVEPAHGLAQLTGLDIVDPGQAARECLALEFQGQTSLLVPAEDAGRVWRYGSADASASRDRLSGEAWLRRRDEVAHEIAATAAEVSRRKHEREAAQAPRIVPPPAEFNRFIRRVPFPLTQDQQSAINETVADLARGRPMERLVCGDVGFGKTEVALHAAMAVALSGLQVAIAAPTTLFARQHLETFRRRSAGFGITVEPLIRSAHSGEARSALRRIASGEARILIGTHALISPGTRFSNLGLVIVDEEQRFGDRHKTQLRALRHGVHALTMTATPLPRSLQSALMGLFDVSLLTEPPIMRQPVRSFVLDFDPVVVRSALLREARRGGQSFVVCPRIEDLAAMGAQLAAYVPELGLTQVHGKMRGEALDQAMLEFAQGRSDVLLATNIIEAGLDIPNANTILVWRPDRFGLAELHQLRERVGRGGARAAAYLLTDPAHPISSSARKRLERIATLERLGAGFAISAADLDLRGAGDLLGEAQSGHIRLLGTELYGHMLLRAMAEANQEVQTPEWRPELAFDVDALIPADAVPEPDVRLELYRRLDRLGSMAAIDDFAEEIEDRFGELAAPLLNLIGLTRLRLVCSQLSIAAVHAGPEAVALTPRPGCDCNALATRLSATLRNDRLIVPIAEAEPDIRLARVAELLVGISHA